MILLYDRFKKNPNSSSTQTAKPDAQRGNSDCIIRFNEYPPMRITFNSDYAEFIASSHNSQ